MEYNIFGGNLPAVTIKLNQGESIYTQSGGMTWMSENMEMSTNMKGGLFKGVGRMLSGDSIFMATYTAKKYPGEITISATFPGEIIVLDLSDGREYVCQKSAFLCAEPSVNLSVTTNKSIKGGFFGGEGFIMQEVKGMHHQLSSDTSRARSRVRIVPRKGISMKRKAARCFWTRWATLR